MTHVIEERSSGMNYQYSIGSQGRLYLRSPPSRAVRKFLQDCFLPQGYPDTVSEDYLDYQKWDTIQALCSSVTGLLSTQAVLKGVGVGDAQATATSAVIQFIVRDLMGMIGRISFAYMKGSSLDSNAKTWRLVADLLNDIALTVELLSPLFPSLFLLLLCFASICKAIVGVAGGCTRAAVSAHQARANNTAEVQAKDGSQETAVCLLGMILALLLTPLLSSPSIIWTLFLLFTLLHLYSNYQCVRVIIFDVFNQQRASLLLLPYLQALSAGHELNNFPSPRSISLEERILPSSPPHTIVLGARVCDLSEDAVVLSELLSLYSKEKYLIRVKGDSIYVGLKEGVESKDILKAFFHSYVISYALSHPSSSSISLLPHDILSVQHASAIGSSSSLAQAALSFTNHYFDSFEKKVRQVGWKTDIHLLQAMDWRIIVSPQVIKKTV